MSVMGRKGKGKQKVEIVKIADEKSLQVTFSKRRYGLFKKASELSTLCGAEVAIVVFSPGKKVFCFGNPSVKSVVNRFFNPNPPTTSCVMQLIEESHYNANVSKFNTQLIEVLTQLEAEKNRGDRLTEMRKSSQRQYWWEAPVDELNQPQLEWLKVALEDLRKKVVKETEKLLIHYSAAPPGQFFRGSSSAREGIQFPFEPNNTIFNGNMFIPPTTAPNAHPQPQPPPPPPHRGYNPKFNREF